MANSSSVWNSTNSMPWPLRMLPPLPRIDDFSIALHGACWFSTLALKSGYWQMSIWEEDMSKTDFCMSNRQLYELTRFLLSVRCACHHLLSNGPGLHQSPLGNLSVLPGWHHFFLLAWEEHLRCLQEIFECLRVVQLKDSADKCTLAAPEVCNLGTALPKMVFYLIRYC